MTSSSSSYPSLFLFFVPILLFYFSFITSLPFPLLLLLKFSYIISFYDFLINSSILDTQIYLEAIFFFGFWFLSGHAFQPYRISTQYIIHYKKKQGKVITHDFEFHVIDRLVNHWFTRLTCDIAQSVILSTIKIWGFRGVLHIKY